MAKKLAIFIVAHSQELIIEFHHKINRSFLDVDYYYILVGEKPETDILKRYGYIFDKTLIPSEFDGNIEHYKNLLTFTAWYWLCHYELPFHIFYTHVGIFEYDVEIKDKMSKLQELRLLHDDDIISFIPVRMDDPLFLKKTPGLLESIDKIYNLNIKNLINRYYQENEDYFWGATTNYIMPIQFLKDFVKFYMKLIPTIFEYDNYPHFHERAVKIYSITKAISTIYMPQLLSHEMRNSHGIKL